MMIDYKKRLFDELPYYFVFFSILALVSLGVSYQRSIKQLDRSWMGIEVPSDKSVGFIVVSGVDEPKDCMHELEPISQGYLIKEDGRVKRIAIIKHSKITYYNTEQWEPMKGWDD